MMNQLINQLAGFKVFLITGVVGGLILLFICEWGIKRLTLTSKSMRCFGYFFGLDGLNQLKTACCLCKFIALVTITLNFKNLKEVHILLFITLSILVLFIRPRLKQFFSGLVNLFLLTTGLIAQLLLMSFVYEIRYEQSYILMCWFIGIFMSCYSLYGLIQEFGQISERKGLKVNESNK